MIVRVRKLALVVTLISVTLLAIGYLPLHQVTAEDAEYGSPELLAEVDWLAEHVDDDELVIVDLRPEDEYTDGHIPNAVSLDLSDTRATVDGIRGQVADAETIADVGSSLGITNQATVVIYDDADGLHAARLFWTLEYYGHEDIRLLNGGWSAWEAAEQPISEDTPSIDPSDFEVTSVEEKRVDAEWILDHLDDDGLLLVDARSPAEYSGETVNAQHGGHIPDAFNMDWHNNIDEDGFFKSQEELEELYASQNLDEAEFLVTYCQTGHRASVAYFTLRLMGYDNVAVYDGSWEEWGNREDLPFETGA